MCRGLKPITNEKRKSEVPHNAREVISPPRRWGTRHPFPQSARGVEQTPRGKRGGRWEKNQGQIRLRSVVKRKEKGKEGKDLCPLYGKERAQDRSVDFQKEKRGCAGECKKRRNGNRTMIVRKGIGSGSPRGTALRGRAGVARGKLRSVKKRGATDESQHGTSMGAQEKGGEGTGTLSEKNFYTKAAGGKGGIGSRNLSHKGGLARKRIPGAIERGLLAGPPNYLQIGGR